MLPPRSWRTDVTHAQGFTARSPHSPRARVRDSDSCQLWPPVSTLVMARGSQGCPTSHQLGGPHLIMFYPLVLLRFVAVFSLMSFSNTLIFDLLFSFRVIMFISATGRVTCSLKPRGLSVAHSIALQHTFKKMFEFSLSSHEMILFCAPGIF